MFVRPRSFSSFCASTQPPTLPPISYPNAHHKHIIQTLTRMHARAGRAYLHTIKRTPYGAYSRGQARPASFISHAPPCTHPRYRPGPHTRANAQPPTRCHTHNSTRPLAPLPSPPPPLFFIAPFFAPSPTPALQRTAPRPQQDYPGQPVGPV